MSDTAKLIYVYDPMCSWCWGFTPAWQQLKQALDGIVTIEYRVGGLAPDSSEPMPEHMQHILQNTWHTISNKLGTKFNFDFWHTCQPRRSTYPACRAALLARKVKKESVASSSTPSDCLVSVSLSLIASSLSKKA